MASLILLVLYFVTFVATFTLSIVMLNAHGFRGSQLPILALPIGSGSILTLLVSTKCSSASVVIAGSVAVLFYAWGQTIV